MNGPVWLTENDVANSVGMADAIEAVRAGLLATGVGDANTMVKTHTAWPVPPDGARKATLHAIGGAFPDQALAGTKTWVHTPRGSQPVVVLFDAATGRVRAVLEAFLLGQLRTGAVSGVATDVFARADAATMAMIGTGRQALPQIAAITHVRPLTEVRVFGRDHGRAHALVESIGDVLGIHATRAGSVRAAARDADVVTLATRATAPVLMSADLPDDAHLNAIGAITPERAEFEPALLDRCRVLCVDSVEQVRALSAELREAFGSDETRWAEVRELGDVLAHPEPDRRTGPSFFKAMGIGLADIALAERCVTRALAAGLGVPLPDRPTEPDLLLAPFRRSARPRGEA